MGCGLSIAANGGVDGDRAGAGQARRDIFVALNDLGDVLMAEGRLADARDAFQRGFDIRTSLAAADPSSAAAQRDVAVCLHKLGMTDRGLKRWASAQENFDQTVRIIEELERRDTSNRLHTIDRLLNFAFVAELRAEIAGEETDIASFASAVADLEAGLGDYRDPHFIKLLNLLKSSLAAMRKHGRSDPLPLPLSI